jgi:hypothetical protein
MALADVYRIFHQTSAQYTFFSAAIELSPQLIGETKQYRTIEIIPCILSDQQQKQQQKIQKQLEAEQHIAQ